MALAPLKGKRKLTWEEIHELERKYKPSARGAPEGFPAGAAIIRLISHIRLLCQEPSFQPQHFCPDWDYLELKPGMEEMSYCHCDFSQQFLWDMIGKLEKKINQGEDDAKDSNSGPGKTSK